MGCTNSAYYYCNYIIWPSIIGPSLLSRLVCDTSDKWKEIELESENEVRNEDGQIIIASFEKYPGCDRDKLENANAKLWS